MIDTILLDMDGTLLPVDEKTFVKAYFGAIQAKVSKLGYDPDRFIAALWKGTEAMNRNDGSVSNRDAFWKVFLGLIGENPHNAELEQIMDGFYAHEFQAVKELLGIQADRRALIDGLRRKGYTLALVTSPVFPAAAVRTRLQWINLKPEDFQLATDYVNSSFCKNDLGYYRDLLRALNKRPEQCLMVGNNVGEDTRIAALGAHVYLVTDMLEDKEGLGVQEFEHGSFSQFEAFAAALPSVTLK